MKLLVIANRNCGKSNFINHISSQLCDTNVVVITNGHYPLQYNEGIYYVSISTFNDKWFIGKRINNIFIDDYFDIPKNELLKFNETLKMINGSGRDYNLYAFGTPKIPITDNFIQYLKNSNIRISINDSVEWLLNSLITDQNCDIINFTE